MPYDSLLIDIGEDFVATLTLNRPDQLNTFNSAMAGELHAALLELDADTKVRVVILKGEGKAFCAGIDVKEMQGKSPLELKAWVENMERPLVAMSQMNKPVIASVHGVAAANGGGLVAAADLAIASEKARIGYTAVNVGLFCLGPAVPLSRVVTRKQALELLLYGELITAQKALEMGLVNQVVAPDDLEKETRRWAARLARKSPLAVQIGKKAFYAMADLEYHKAFDLMNEAFARLCSTEDGAEGVNAFLGKRDPVWKGR